MNSREGQEAVGRLQDLVQILEASGGDTSGGDTSSTLSQMAEAVRAVNIQLVSDAKTIADLNKQVAELRKENTALQDEGFLLKRRIEQEHETVARAVNEKISLQSAVEADDERMFNMTTRIAPPAPIDTSAAVNSAAARRASLLEIMNDVRNEASAESSAQLDEDGCLSTGRSPKFPPSNRSSPATSVCSQSSAGYNPMRRRSTLTTPSTSPGMHPARATGDALAALDASVSAVPPFSLSAGYAPQSPRSGAKLQHRTLN